MLVLSRKLHEKIIINGNIVVEVTAIAGSKVRIGIDAPPDVRIVRAELERKDDQK
jgi:carbon storage regulator